VLSPEASARGAALLALEACGIINDICRPRCRCGDEVQPNQGTSRRLQARSARQNALYDQIYAGGAEVALCEYSELAMNPKLIVILNPKSGSSGEDFSAAIEKGLQSARHGV
jgi:hypothetical protein